MSPLNIHPEESTASAPKKKKSKTLKVMLGLAALVLVPVIGNTFAASITLNNNTAVQFAQGKVDTAECDTTMTVEAGSTYMTVSGTADFYLTSITISDINLDSGCEDKTLVVSVDAGTGAEADLITGVTQASIEMSETAGSLTATSGFTATLVNTSDVGEVTITIGSPVLVSDSVTKFLIQSS
jgi:hypothetical protein